MTSWLPVHNSRALYNALQTSLTGDIKTQIFSQISNVPIVDDVLFFHMTKLPISSDIQIYMSAFKNILNFNPEDYN